MQILMGTRETFIKLDKNDKVQNIIEFINTKFKFKHKSNQVISISYKAQEHYSRVFLLKWLCSMYSRSLPHEVPFLKESILNRIHKPIKVQMPLTELNEIYRIKIEVESLERLKIFMLQKNNELFYALKSLLVNHSISSSISNSSIIVALTSNKSKLLIQDLLNQKKIIDKNVEFSYIEYELQESLKIKVHSGNIVLQDAYKVLNINSYDTNKEIKNKYKVMAKQYHPDVIYSSLDIDQNLYTKKFQSIQNAYETIKQYRY
ncbi:J domain-containing protein [Sulfurimonas sp.]|nr:J domain-containing protein [Sulfurimonas sp.]